MADRISDLTTDELRALVEDAVLVHRPEGLRREDMYGDDGR